MSETSTDPSHSNKQSTDDKNKAKCHIVSLPSIVLTRIDEVKVPVGKPTNSLKKRTKNIGKKFLKTNVNKAFSQNAIVKRPRGRPRKEDLPSNVPSLKKQNNSGRKPGATNKIGAVKKLPKTAKVNSDVKNMLKKTMLQKRSKIAIPPAKKPKLTTPKTTKVLPPKKDKPILPKTKAVIPPKLAKPTPPKPKSDILLTKSVDTDSSEDEFLYDELIEELENTPTIQFSSVKSVSEKTTNITLKPNMGNKLPTVVKGGIIKRVNLPADLKPIATPNLNSSTLVNTLLPDKDTKSALTGRKTKLQNSLDGPNPAKKPSPWPISISSPIKSSIDTTQTKNQKKPGPKANINTVPSNIPSKPKNVQKTPKVTTQPLSISTNPTDFSSVSSKPVSLDVVRPKIGPKQTAKVVPISKSLNEDDNLSDEYTEEETLENYDSEPLDNGPKLENDHLKNYKSVEENSINVKTTTKPIIPCYDDSKDDEDPHLDLLRILTDDTEEQVHSQPFESKRKSVQAKEHSSSDTSETPRIINSNPPSESKGIEQNSATTNEVEEESPVRTIYDLMNEIALQYPSWNLHIIPETSAFCIAQVTKGRLGLPTLKKCIELDPVDYNAKVYIHQYHIKRFNGVYDSEESILALIQEINSIKA